MVKFPSKIGLIGISIALVLPLAFTKVDNQRANIAGLLILALYLSSVNLLVFFAISRLKKLVIVLTLALLVAPVHVVTTDCLTTKDYSDWCITSLMLFLGLIVYAIISVLVAAVIMHRNPLINYPVTASYDSSLRQR